MMITKEFSELRRAAVVKELLLLGDEVAEHKLVAVKRMGRLLWLLYVMVRRYPAKVTIPNRPLL